MGKKKKSNGVARLAKLADRLEKEYPKAGDRVAELVEPVDEAIRRIGVTFQAEHFAEAQLWLLENQYSDRGAATHPYAFASETTSAGTTEYALCAARGHKRECGLYVSVCQHDEHPVDDDESDGPTFKILGKYLVRPNELPLPIRVRILDKLDDFVEAYQEHVMEDRKALLNGTADTEKPE